MVRGGSKVVLPWCRALLGRQGDKIRGGISLLEGGGIGVASCGHFSTIVDVTVNPGRSKYLDENETSLGAAPRRDESASGEKGFSFSGFRADATDVGNKSTNSFSASEYPFGASSAGAVNVSPESGKGPYHQSSRFPEVPQPTLRNDRYFRSRNNSAVANMLKLLEAAASQDEVEKILEEQIPDSTVSSCWPWLPLLEALQRGPKPYLSLEVFNWKKDKFDGGDPREYAKMISTAGKLNQLEIATTLFREMEEKGVKRSPITCNALMSAFSKNDQANDAVAIFREMVAGEDCKPTLVTYNTLISMYSKLSIPDMEKYFNMCKLSGFYPDRVTFNSMIWGYMRGRQFDKMEEMYEQLKKSGCRPDPITFSALIIGFSKAGETEKMELSFNHMQEEGFPISTMISEILTEYYAATKKFDKMERIMKILSNTTGSCCSSKIYGFAIHSYAESGRIKDMEETMDKMFTSKRLFTSTKTLEAVISAYGSYSNFEGLAMVLDRIKSMGWAYQHSTYHTLLYEYGKGKELGRMEEVFNEMKNSIDVEPTEETYKILADSYRSAGDEEGVIKIVNRMSAAGFKTKEVTDIKTDRVWTDDEIFGGRPR